MLTAVFNLLNCYSILVNTIMLFNLNVLKSGIIKTESTNFDDFVIASKSLSPITFICFT